MASLTAANPYFGWDLVRVVQELFRYAFMQHAFEAGTIVAISAGIIGYFVVLRGLSFAAHALSHIGFAGATGGVLLGASPLVGLLAFTMSAGAVMGALGQRLRGRDVTIGLVMAWSLGLGLLFTALYQRHGRIVPLAELVRATRNDESKLRGLIQRLRRNLTRSRFLLLTHRAHGYELVLQTEE